MIVYVITCNINSAYRNSFIINSYEFDVYNNYLAEYNNFNYYVHNYHLEVNIYQGV